MAPSPSLGSRAGPRPGSCANPTPASSARCHTGLGHTGLRSLQGEGVGVPRARSQPLKKFKEPISLPGWNRSLPPSLIEVICCLGKRSVSSDTGCVSASPRVCMGTVLGSGHLEGGLGTCMGTGLAALLFGVVCL